MARVDTVTGLLMLVKRTTEAVVYDFDFTGLLGASENITSIASIAQTRRGTVAGSVDLTLGTPLHNGAKLAQVQISGGTDGEFYCIDMIADTSAGQQHQCSGVINVEDPC